MSWRDYGGTGWPAGYYGYGSWGERWWWALQRLGAWKRVSAAWNYGRRVQVLTLDVGSDGVTATVQGNDWDIHQVRLRCTPFPAAVWEEVIRALAAEARHAVSLLAGQIPDGIEQALAATGPSLLPASADEIAAACSCPDPVVPCKHMVAVCYQLYRRITAEPLLLLALRGRTAEEVVAALRTRRRQGPAETDIAGADDAPHPLGEDSLLGAGPEGFWRIAPGLEDLPLSFRPPPEDALPVKQVGAVPYGYTRKEFMTVMERAYQAISAHALRLTMGEE